MNGRNQLIALLVGGDDGRTTPADLGLAVLRVSLGVYIAAHGLAKLDGFGLNEGFVAYTGKLGFPAPAFFAFNAVAAEVIGGLLLVLGLFTRPVAAVLVFNMGVAAFVAHGSDPFLAAPGQPSKEMAMLYLIPFLAYALGGAGRLSVDGLVRRALYPPAHPAGPGFPVGTPAPTA